MITQVEMPGKLLDWPLRDIVVASYGDPPADVRWYTLERHRDVTGISGTGSVADIAVLPNGEAVMKWHGDRSSLVLYRNLDDLISIHGHEGSTEVVPV